jgi:rhamnose utilization protein RhaD (predicted bifunctional aldolase and dehydrogenase)
VKILEHLVAMSRELAAPELGQVILAEGNASAKEGPNLWIKASGRPMDGISEDGFVQVDRIKVLQALERHDMGDDDLRRHLNDCRCDLRSPLLPSTETFTHAWLLERPGVNYVAHTHPVHVLAAMCGPRPAAFANERYFPDQIVLCGPRSVLVPYVAPGLALARAVRDGWTAFEREMGRAPKTVLMTNHGMIAVGGTAREALAACLMTEKAARVFLAAGTARPLTPQEVAHIDSWTDEHYRQSQLWSDE